MNLEMGIVKNKKLMTDMNKMTDKTKDMENDLKRLIEQHKQLELYLKKSQKLLGIELNTKITTNF